MTVSEKPLPTVEIALDLHLFGTYHYVLPEPLVGRAEVGMRVLVPVGPRRLTGYLVGFSPPPPDIELKEVIDLLDERALFDEQLLKLYQFLSRYLFVPLGEVIRGALPAGINIESRQSILLTETGKFARHSGLLRGPKADILDGMSVDGEIRVSELIEQVPTARRYHIHDLVRDGFLVLREDMTKPRIQAKKESFYRIVEGASLARLETFLKRSPQQREVYHLIDEHNEISATTLRKLMGTVTAALRSLLRKGLIDVEEREVSADPFFAEELAKKAAKPTLTPKQEDVLSGILSGVEQGGFHPFLLHGVTGSGKTELYLRVIEAVLERKKQAIVLVPEIALTPQFVGVFRQRLGDQMAVLHSGLTDRERFDQWWRICRHEVSLVIGARSAIFAPFRNVGVIIVDEEHETSYKQEGKFPYHARNLALVRGKEAQALVILGSATPAFESYNNAHNGLWRYLTLPERVHQRPMPEIEVIDMRQVGFRPGGILSPQLKAEIEQNLINREQTILLLNRRGYHSSVVCSECGHAFWCLHCSVSLTHHRGQRSLICHYCGYTEPEPQQCPKCASPALEFLGRGTEKVHDILQEIFPEARIERMDRDTISGKRSTLENLVERLVRREVDILVGTQMVAKGHDFPGVTLVGVLLADTGMNLPDFRSAERTFQLLMQVAGRAGRGDKPGRVAIQTFNPTHPSIRYVQQHDYHGFYETESAIRREMGYPPYGWLVAIRFEGNDPDQVRQVAETIGRSAARLLQEGQFPGVVFLGPAPAPIERIKSKFRWQMLFKSASRRYLHDMISQLLHQDIAGLRQSPVKITIDPDPVHML